MDLFNQRFVVDNNTGTSVQYSYVPYNDNGSYNTFTTNTVTAPNFEWKIIKEDTSEEKLDELQEQIDYMLSEMSIEYVDDELIIPEIRKKVKELILKQKESKEME